MQFYQIILTAVALGCDAFTVALGIGSKPRFKGQSFRLGFHFGLFQLLMTWIGCGIGQGLVHWASDCAPWIASGVVAIVGGRMLYEAFSNPVNQNATDFSRGWYLVTLSVATSIDALAIGFAFGIVRISPWIPGLVIGLVAGVMTLSGLYLGRKLRTLYGHIIEIFGACVLFFIAYRLLYL